MYPNTQPLPPRPSSARGSAIVTGVRRHPVSAYFALAYTFSWALSCCPSLDWKGGLL